MGDPPTVGAIMVFSFAASLISSYWIFLLAALLIGVVVGWFVADDERNQTEQSQ